MDAVIEQGLSSPDVETRRKTALSLADLPLHEALSPLVELIGDANWRVRKAAVETLLNFPPGATIPQLIQALHDPGNAGRRNSAVEAIIKVGQEALPTIYEHLVTDDVDVKLSLLYLLGEIPNRQNAPYLVYYLNHEDKNLVSAAILSLGMLKDPGNLRVLNDLLRRRDDWLLFHLVDALALIGGPEALDKLFDLYQELRLRKAILKAFGRMGNREAVPFVLECMGNEDAPALEVMETLGRLYYANMPDALLKIHRREMAEEVRRHFPLHRIRLLEELWATSKTPERRGMILVAGFLSELSLLDKVLGELDNPYLAHDALQSIQAYGPAATHDLIRRLNSCPPQEQRMHLIQLLAATGSEDAVVPLIVQSREDDFQIRTEALQALGSLESLRSLGELVKVLKEEDYTYHETALSAIRSLVLRHQDFRENLKKPAQEMVHHSHEAVRRAAYALLSEAYPRDNQTLAPGLSDPSPQVRQAVVYLIAKVGGEETFLTLEPLLQDEDPRVRRAVVLATGRELLSHKPDLLKATLADPDVWVRAEAAFYMAQSTDKASTEAIQKVLEGDELPVRIGALRGLSEVGCGVFFDKVLQLARTSAEPVEVQQAALTSLARSGRPGAANVLIDCLRDPRWEIRSTAIHLIGVSGDHRYIPSLLKELERDSDDLVRQAIIAALIQLKATEAVPRMLQYLTDPKLKDAAYWFFISLGRNHIRLIENEANSVDFQTKLVLIEILKQLENA